MKKILVLTALAALFAVPAFAGIKATRHNLGTTGDYGYKSAGTTQICIYCHTPHNATKPVPLWNRSNPTGAFKMYTLSGTLNNTVPDNLAANSISRFCLSCHDAVNSTNLGGRVKNTFRENVAISSGAANLKGKASLGTDLTNDHPVGFRIVNDSDTSIAVTNAIEGTSTAQAAGYPKGGLVLYNLAGGSNYLECATCHDPHSQTNKKFLRKGNDSSSLCLTCHQK